MNISFVCRQFVTLARVLIEHMGSDPVFFGVQVSRRLSGSVSTAVGRGLNIVPASVARTAGKWLTGDTAGAEADLQNRLAAGKTDKVSSRLYSEFALSLRMLHEAETFAEHVRNAKTARSLRARIAWQKGDMSGAVMISERGRLHSRLKSEQKLFERNWLPAPPAQIPRFRAPKTNVMHLLTNSLPHTQSGYTLRSHYVLKAVQSHGLQVLAGTRTGYPVSVGGFSWRDRETVDGVTYLRDIPWDQGRTATRRVEKQAAFAAAVAVASRAEVLHTTTHFVNGLATAAAAKKLGLPWVYEVRGALEETWAASATSPTERLLARSSERFEFFRARETEVARRADRVVTLGATMARELVKRGVPEERILVAPNAVSEDLLKHDIHRPTDVVRREKGLPENGVWVGTAASIVGYEGLDVLIDAVAEARREGADLRLLIVGDGVELPMLKQRAASLGEAVVFTGRLPQRMAHELITALDIFAVPRRNDPVCSLVTPLKPVEAAGLGRPVVLSDLPALTEALPSRARSAITAGSVPRWAEELTRLALDADARLEMGQAGRTFVKEHRTWDSVGHAYTKMYSELGVGGSR
ncbi:glycosyltransferase family 4 protein [Brevibacterium luteolum]|uniref:glycosyltransferase family 4 protein n=1 Tax=Brevibacterium luteolum TaxID=199591 RepID=UPI00223B409B|nr:glycosyltransferase family 4 protein [Brevibacterium luteolum]MCT1656926.1 glycosyltransferase family 4 protein [Brevibacterium luteolum]